MRDVTKEAEVRVMLLLEGDHGQKSRLKKAGMDSLLEPPEG